MKATYQDTVIAEAPTDDLVKIEGNWYFPPSSVADDLLSTSPTPYTCAWKGACQYWNVTVNGVEKKDLAWSYPEIHPSAVDRAGLDFSGYIAFDRSVTFSE
ncbi:DUF427 domain-containing protein [Mycetocola zhadangensis]|uniref:DUF427 domain-containing protein n=1 Tax=Mycetocola zhadangensis TaxID=1164595 RepID=A0A3L7J7A2_9MICO|nr:DUF427 domain-containing protein [Mycetocola zhadangensis]RLQ85331.1 DUF427 domain-containing protein [Mycetocola zhadangensis]GGE81721.1 hypothetical protein GCM10011313_00110 [Mycetocola zhadangensis]